MNSPFDLYAIPLFRRDGQDQSYLPNFLAMETPRRAARGRKDERLVLLVEFQGSLELRRDQIAKLLQDMADGYFGTSGSATSALRGQADRLNSYLLEQNQSGAVQPPARALLGMIVIKDDRALIAQCGPMHGFLLDGDNIEHFYDPAGAGRGLGLSQQTQVRFFQAELGLGAALLTLTQVPTGWNEQTLLGVHGQQPASLRRRFLSQAGADLTAALVATQPGKGKFHVVNERAALEDLEPAPTEAPPMATPRRADPPIKAEPQPTPAAPDERSWEAIEVPPEEADERAEEVEDTSPVPVPAMAAEVPARADDEYIDYDYADPVEDAGTPPLEMLGALAERASQLFGRFTPGLRNLLLRLLPEETSLNLPASAMAVIAIAVPVVVVVIVSLVYLQLGRGQLYTNYMQQAQSAAASAEALEDSSDARQAWELALYYAGQAEPYQEADEATTLRLQAQDALDELDYVERLDFQLALFGPLPDSAEITRMVATSTDLYMLNQTDGSVIRAFLTSGGYSIDEGFDCGPGPYGGYIVSALIDVALLPRENPQNAAVVAMDANGNLIYCVVDGRPLATPLAPPDSNWGRPAAITVANENLYVLDPLTNAVWIYFGEDFAFVDEPRFFFAQEVPTLSNGLDFGVQDGELYVLGLDGQIAYCEYSGDLENPTTCSDPLDYSDTRPGRSGGPTVEGAHFLQLQVTEPPEPSVYLADAVNGAIYQFSLRLNLVRQFRSTNPLPEAVVSAFTVSPNRALFLAFDNQIYIGFLP